MKSWVYCNGTTNLQKWVRNQKNVSKIAIVTDTSADIPSDITEEFDIHVAHAFVHFGTETYVVGDLKMEDFYSMMATADDEDFPKTSQPRANDILEIYEKLKAQGYDHILSIHVSSRLSGTINSANVAKGLIDEIDIRIIDSLGVSANLMAVVLEARSLIDSGMWIDEIETELEQFAMQLRSYISIRSMENLHRGGRISKIRYRLGWLLNIKPVLELKQGILGPYAKARGVEKAQDKMYESATKRFDRDYELNYIIVHTKVKNEAQAIENRLKGDFPKAKGYLIDMGIVVAVHGGEGSIMLLTY